MAEERETRRGRPPSKKKIKSATFRLPQELLDRLATEAETQERSQTTLVKRALEAYLAQQAEEEEQ